MKALGLLLLPLIALGQGRFNFPPDAIRSSDLRTSAAMTLYVDPTGSDGNACTGTGTSACLTIAGALAKVPRLICHAVTINVAAGNYTGAVIDGFRPCSGPVDSSNRGTLNIIGTLINATPATGSATFVFTSQTAGTANTATWGVLNQTAATWTTNDLRGLLVEASALSLVRPIASNTATSISLVGPSSGSATTSTSWAIRDWGSVITTGATFPGSGASTNYAGFFIGDAPRSYGNFITIQSFKVSSAVPKCIYIDGEASVFLRYLRCDTGTSTSDQINAPRGWNGTIQDSVLKPNNARYGISVDLASFLTVQRTFFWGNPGIGLRAYDVRELLEGNNYFLNSVQTAETYGRVGVGTIAGNKYETTSSTFPCLGFGGATSGTTIGANTMSSALGQGHVLLSANTFTSCGGSAIYATGPVYLESTSSTGSGSGRYGFELLNAARVKLVSGNTVTGTSGDTAVGPTPTVTAYGSVGTGVASSADFARIAP